MCSLLPQIDGLLRTGGASLSGRLVCGLSCCHGSPLRDSSLNRLIPAFQQLSGLLSEHSFSFLQCQHWTFSQNSFIPSRLPHCNVPGRAFRRANDKGGEFCDCYNHGITAIYSLWTLMDYGNNWQAFVFHQEQPLTYIEQISFVVHIIDNNKLLCTHSLGSFYFMSLCYSYKL